MNNIIIFLAKYLFLASLIIGGIFFFKLQSSKKIKFFIICIISGLFSLAILKISSIFIIDPRPFVVNHVMPLIPHTPDNGFPSDHTLLTMWLAFIVFLYNKRTGFILILISLLVGVSRVMALIHHPIDILGGIIIAVTSVLAGNKVLHILVKNS